MLKALNCSEMFQFLSKPTENFGNFLSIFIFLIGWLISMINQIQSKKSLRKAEQWNEKNNVNNNIERNVCEALLDTLNLNFFGGLIDGFMVVVSRSTNTPKWEQTKSPITSIHWCTTLSLSNSTIQTNLN